MGTLAQRRDGGHGGVDAVLPRLVAGGGHHTPFASIAHSDRLTAIIRIVALLDGGVERIHIDMDDLAVHRDKYNSPNIRLHTISALITAMGSPAPGVVEAPT